MVFLRHCTSTHFYRLRISLNIRRPNWTLVKLKLSFEWQRLLLLKTEKNSINVAARRWQRGVSWRCCWLRVRMRILKNHNTGFNCPSVRLINDRLMIVVIAACYFRSLSLVFLVSTGFLGPWGLGVWNIGTPIYHSMYVQ